MLKIKDLTLEQLAKFAWWRCDEFYEKHESFGYWCDRLEDNEFVEIEGRNVLIPRMPDDLRKLVIDEVIVSQDKRVLTIFLKDLSYTNDWQNPTESEIFINVGAFAICYRPEGEEFYVAAVYHSRYIVPGPVASSGEPRETQIKIRDEILGKD